MTARSELPLAQPIDATTVADLPDAASLPSEPPPGLDVWPPDTLNTRRAVFAASAVKAYAATDLADGSTADVRETLVELLTDLRHLCNALDVTYDHLVAESHRAYVDDLNQQ